MDRTIEYTRIERSKRDSPIFVDTKIGTVPARRPWAGKVRWLLAALLAVAMAGGIVQTAAAQAPGAIMQTPAAQSPPPQRPGNIEVMLVKNALTAVNQGNLTGNYTVLRDLGSAAFRDKNSAAKLSTIFQNLRDRKFDLSPILVLDPQFTQAPAMNQAGQLQLVGFFPTQPLQVRFGLAFQRVEAGWMIETISVGAGDPQPQRSTVPDQQDSLQQARLPQPYVR